jgi:hypothetical protein
MVLPDGGSILEIPPGLEGITVIRGIDCSDSWVHLEDALVVPPWVVVMPGVILSAPLFSKLFPWFKPCICGPQLHSRVLHFVAFCRLHKIWTRRSLSALTSKKMLNSQSQQGAWAAMSLAHSLGIRIGRVSGLIL